MRVNGKQPVVLVALNFPTAAEDIAALEGAGVTNFEGGTGCFEGHREQCYALPIEQFTQEVKDLLKAREQKCVMYLDNQYNAWLSYNENNYAGYNVAKPEVMATYVGEFKSTTQQQAEKAASWTRFGGQYYVARR